MNVKATIMALPPQKLTFLGLFYGLILLHSSPVHSQGMYVLILGVKLV